MVPEQMMAERRAFAGQDLAAAFGGASGRGLCLLSLGTHIAQ